MANLLLGILAEASPDLPDSSDWKGEKINTAKSEKPEDFNKYLLEFQSIERRNVALFLPDIFQNQDQFSPLIRRFVQVGETQEDRIRNAFELGFEKGFDKVLLIRSNYLPAIKSHLNKLAEQLNQADLVVIPGENGKIVALGLTKDLFWNWSLFDWDEDEVVVEMLAFCHESGIKYDLSQLDTTA